MILDNPFRSILPQLKSPPASRPADPEDAVTWESIQSLYSQLFAMLERVEWHEETVYDTPTTIPHRLGRLPEGHVIVMNDSPYAVQDLVTQWTRSKIVLQHSGGGGIAIRVRYALF